MGRGGSVTSPAAESETFREMFKLFTAGWPRALVSDSRSQRGRCAQAAAAQSRRDGAGFRPGQAALGWRWSMLIWNSGGKPDLVRKLGGRGAGKGGTRSGSETPRGPMRPDESEAEATSWLV